MKKFDIMREIRWMCGGEGKRWPVEVIVGTCLPTRTGVSGFAYRLVESVSDPTPLSSPPGSAPATYDIRTHRVRIHPRRIGTAIKTAKANPQDRSLEVHYEPSTIKVTVGNGYVRLLDLFRHGRLFKPTGYWMHDTPPLIFCDWLDDNSEAEAAELVRDCITATWTQKMGYCPVVGRSQVDVDQWNAFQLCQHLFTVTNREEQENDRAEVSPRTRGRDADGHPPF